MSRKISIIHPSRNRPELAKQVFDEWMGKAAKPEDVGYTLSIDNDDPMGKEYKALFEPVKCLIVQFPNKSAIGAINRGAKFTRNDLLIVVSDDFSCPQNWDADLLSALKDKEDFCVKTWDGAQPWIMTLPIMDRVYYNRFGYIYPPHIRHMFADTWMSHVADLLDRKVIVNMHFPHRHYSQPGGIRQDAISKRNDATWGQGEFEYIEGVKNNFGLKDEEIKGVLRCDNNHAEWLKKMGIEIKYI